MTTDESGALAVPGPDADQQGDFFAGEAHRIAAQWGELPPEHFKVAVQAAKAEGALRSQERVLRMRLTHEIELMRVEAEKVAAEARARAEQQVAKQQASMEAARLRHRRHVIDVSAGLVTSLALLVVALLVVDKSVWLSGVLAGPSLLSLARIFVLRKSEAGDTKNAGRVTGGPPAP
ncbi:hypothetical protein OG866_44370 [Streptomyces sp. NBC_00663]|uniref:hypothetical protein n=1 Tax=Streptomyces sp. NBC_00663 TaxID=2975801 RepID=UPI002E30D1A0|nr:hypothetical protein [Streptomyces sp. NBC_00663]